MMAGMPHSVSITGSDSGSVQGALNHLLNGLQAFGFVRRLAVEDATEFGRTNRYEVPANRW